jgi:hypothetical protein
MTSFTLDTNCFYAVVNGEPDAAFVRALADAHRTGTARGSRRNLCFRMVARSSLPLTAISMRRQKSLLSSPWERARFVARWRP